MATKRWQVVITHLVLAELSARWVRSDKGGVVEEKYIAFYDLRPVGTTT